MFQKMLQGGGGSDEPVILLGASNYVTGDAGLCSTDGLTIDNTSGYFEKTISDVYLTKLVATKSIKIKIVSSISRTNTNISRKIYKNGVEILKQSLNTNGGNVQEIDLDMKVGDYLSGQFSISDTLGRNGYTLLILLIK